MFYSSPARYLLAAGCLVLTLNAAAGETKSNNPNAGMRYAAISIQGDDESNRQLIGALGLTIGDHSWVQVGGGTLHIQQGNDTLNPSLINLGAGIIGKQLSFSLDASQHKDGDKYRQYDWSSTLDWHNNKVGLGIDGLHRNTELRGTVPTTNNQGATVNVPVSQSLKGNGIGLHAQVSLTERLTVSAGGMNYSYDSKIYQDTVGTTSGSNSGLINALPNDVLSNQSLLANPSLTQVSGVTREAAILQYSWNAGIVFRLPRVALSAQYFNDKAIDNSGTLMTTKLCAAIFIDEHWVLSPGIGYSTKSQSDGVAFALLTARYGW